MSDRDDAIRLYELRSRIDAGRVRIDDARKKGFDVAAWESQLNAMRREYEELADEVFVSTKERVAS